MSRVQLSGVQSLSSISFSVLNYNNSVALVFVLKINQDFTCSLLQLPFGTVILEVSLPYKDSDTGSA